MDFNKMLREAQKMQKKLKEEQEALEAKEFQIQAAGGAVELVITGGYEVKSIKINKDIIDPEDSSMLEDALMIAFNEGVKKIQVESEKISASLTSGMGIPGLIMEPIKSVTDLKRSFQKLPGIGEKTAERLAYASLRFKKEELDEFINALYNVKTNVHPCPNCGMYIDTPSCPICNDPSRNDDTLLVVSDAKNIISFEKTDMVYILF